MDLGLLLRESILFSNSNYLSYWMMFIDVMWKLFNASVITAKVYYIAESDC